MPSNYDQITRENIRRRGEEFDDIGRLISEQLYSDRTHFLYELLQNAEDALWRRVQADPQQQFPRSVTFDLTPTELRVRHFGQPFSQEDVRAISDVLHSTSTSDSGRIGRFGIGFKSVYAFTTLPHIYSGDEHFRIERFIRPQAVAPQPLQEGETLFVFPFDHETFPSSQAFTIIRNRLSDLGPRTLLFLRHIDTMCWASAGRPGGTYRREIWHHDGHARHIRLITEIQGRRTEEHWLVFERPVRLPGCSNEVRVEVAYLLANDSRTGKDYIKPVTDARLAVFFPTDKDTRLGFLIQGPYLTTPARDNIVSAPENSQLILETARLVVDSLTTLKQMGLLTVSTLQALPIKSSDFPAYGVFRPIFDQVRAAFQTQPLLPAHNPAIGFIAASQAKLARSKDLRELLSDTQLRNFFKAPGILAWLPDDITFDKTPDLRNYILKELGVSEIDSEEFASLITDSFIQEQHDDWMIDFYAFLEGKTALWRAAHRYAGGKAGVLRNKPVIRLQNGTHVPPFRENGEPAAYLPVGTPSTLPTVKETIARNEQAREFLRRLGLTEPDLIAEVIEEIIPKYESFHGQPIPTQENQRDVRAIMRVLRTVGGEKKRQLLERLRTVPFLLAVNAGTGQQCFQKPSVMYRQTDELACYFEGNPQAWFLDASYEPFLTFLIELGVSETVRATYRKPDSTGYIPVFQQSGHYERGLNGFDPDAKLDGLEYALEHITVEKAAYIWNTLLPPLHKQMYGKTERSSRKTFTNSHQEKFFSRMGHLLTNRSWLPTEQNRFARPEGLLLYKLPPQFHRNTLLAGILKMRSDESRHPISKELGFEVEPEEIEFLKKHWKDITRLKHKLERESQTVELDLDEDADEAIDYAEELRTAFTKLGAGGAPDEPILPGTAANPGRRREVIAQEIKEHQRQEPEVALRFKQVPRKAWEAKDNQVRIFLREQYGGKCQICETVFSRRDNQPYFEGLYLVSRTRKRWIDRPGNVLCLCPNCCAKFLYGAVEAPEDILDQIDLWRARKEGGSGAPVLDITLCGQPVTISFTEQHMIDLQELLHAAACEMEAV